jgi:Uma2 family endonuclease
MAVPARGEAAMEQIRQRRFTADEFIAWAMEQPSGRYELVDGVVCRVAPERVNHARAKADVYVVLRAAIEAGGIPCEAIIDGVGVQVDERTVYEPDAMVRCGPYAPGEAVKVSDPLIVVEVVSPSTGSIDTGVKFEGYFSLPSVRHYLVINPRSRVVTHHRRGDDGAVVARLLRAGVLALDPPGIEIEVADLFASIPRED